jgi:crotonyl-CoA carboxylase/reductase
MYQVKNDWLHHPQQIQTWGVPPHWTDEAGQKEWTAGCRAFGKAIWDALGSEPDIVFEHPGKQQFTSVFVCEAGGMVIAAGTTGYSASVDLRYHWVDKSDFRVMVQ